MAIMVRMARAAIAPVVGFAALAAVTAPAAAQDTGYYLFVHGGASWLSDQNFSTLAGEFDFEYDTGYAAGGGVGFDFGPLYQGVSLRSDLEITLREYDVKTYTVNGTTDNSGQGQAGSIGVMANFYGYIPTESPLAPYFGIGVGFAEVAFEEYSDTTRELILDDNDSVFAYQLIAGADYALTRELLISLDYRFFATEDPELRTFDSINVEDVEVDNRTHSVLIGLRYLF